MPHKKAGVYSTIMNNASKAHEYFHNVIILDADYAYYADFTVLNPHNMRNPRLKTSVKKG